MKKSMCITYVVDNNLYVNITNKCSNRCDFCIRKNGDGAYGSDSLWLEREPSVEEILSYILSHNVSDYGEIVFCGYGEPSYRLQDAVAVTKEVKRRFPNTLVRINTNGQSDLILKRSTAKEYAVFDTVSISLNSPTPDGYDRICHSEFGECALSAILDFAKEVVSYVPNTVFSVVGDFLTDSEIQICREISERCGVALKVRDYIPPQA